MERRPTLEAVARRAGVSTATVSRVLNESARVSPAMRAAVEAAVAELGYVPNPAARNLARRRTDTIALVVSEPGDRLFADPFFPAVVHGIAEELADTALQLVILPARGERQQRKVERYVLEGHVDGTIMVSLHADDVLPHALAAAQAPLVLAGRPSREAASTSWVDTDNRAGGRLATEHLLATRQHVATITGPPDMTVSGDRFAGYRDALGDRPPIVAHGDFGMESGRAATDELLRAEPRLDGLFAASDAMAVGALQALAAAGRRVPDDVAVVGFDDVELAAAATPPLTTVRQPWDELTRALVELLGRRIAGSAEPEHVVLTPTLVRRASA
ncbi:MAG TPA: LacI family DNA-binding transcriptional regulator [Gaiellaceae bacterium]|nr:LacI family DNA-binding transcriptional regulator [Gaiellaceae bacterium]